MMLLQVHCNSDLSSGALRLAISFTTHSLAAVIAAHAAGTCGQSQPGAPECPKPGSRFACLPISGPADKLLSTAHHCQGSRL